jgi:ParB-like chromosome segregation protein Spo0J
MTRQRLPNLSPYRRPPLRRTRQLGRAPANAGGRRMSADPEKYQLLPELDPESFAALKADIAARGIIVPVLVDEFGAIIDGHNRARACRELGINDYPVEVRSDLSEADKRTLARKLNMLRRHLSREQVRQLIGDQLRDTPEWADRRIGRELGVDHKTVGAVRADLGSTGEIPQLEKTVGGDDKARPAKPSRRSRKQATHDEWTDKDDDWDDDDRPRWRRVDPWIDPTKTAKFHHAADLIRLGVDPNSDQVNKLIRESAACVIEGAGYRIFAHCTAAGERDWHLFILFLTREWNWHPEGAGCHVEYLSQKQFMDPDEWLGEEGARFRRGWTSEPSEEFKQAWASFKQANSGRTQAEIIAETEAIYQERDPAKRGTVS